MRAKSMAHERVVCMHRFGKGLALNACIDIAPLPVRIVLTCVLHRHGLCPSPHHVQFSQVCRSYAFALQQQMACGTLASPAVLPVNTVAMPDLLCYALPAG
jgi:hypothetical protein